MLSFHDDASEETAATKWFERGAQSGCIHSRLEQWRRAHRQQVSDIVSAIVVFFNIQTFMVLFVLLFNLLLTSGSTECA